MTLGLFQLEIIQHSNNLPKLFTPVSRGGAGMFRFRGRGRHNNQEVQHYRRKDVIFCEPIEKDQLIRESRHQSDTKDRKKV